MSGKTERKGHARRETVRGRVCVARAARVGLASVGAASIAALAGPGRAQAAEIVWNLGADAWGNPAAWTPNQAPQTAADDALIAGGTVTLDAAYSVGALTLSGGVIAGTNDLTLAGLMTWSAGAMVDTGATRATAGLLLTGSDKILNERALVTDGLATWDAGHLITANGAAVVNNGTFVAAFDGDVQSQGTPTAFANPGVFRKTAGAGGTSATTISAAFHSAGAVHVQAGRLALAGGGSASGAFDLSAGAELVLRDGYAFAPASAVGGAGGVRFEFGASTVAGAYAVTGTTTVAGGAVDFAAAATTGDLVLSGGALTGGGTVTASGAVTWTGTVLQGTGAVVATGTLEISGPGHGLGGRTLTNAGAGTWAGGDIQFSGGATLNNTGTLSSTFAGSMQTSGPNPGSFINTGLYDRSGPGGTTINPVLINGGTVRVSQGTLTLAGGGSATGRFEVLPGARLRVVNYLALAAGSRVSGSGTVEFAGGVNTVGGEYTVTGNTDVFGGVTTFTGNITALGATLSLFGGFAKFDAPVVQAHKLDQFGGGIDGSGNVVFAGPVTWDSGPQKGSGATTANAGLAISGPAAKSLEDRTLVNAAGSTATWSDGQILGFGNGTLRNDGTFLVPFDASFVTANGSPQFLNTGLLVKTGGTGLASFAAALNNSGTVRVDAGGIYLGSGSSSGNLDLAGGGAQFLSYALADGATVTGTNKGVITGALAVTGAATARHIEQGPGAQMTGPGTLTIETFDWLGGRLTGGGTTAVTATLTLDGLGKEVDGRTLRVAPGAVATWTAGDLAVYAGSAIDNLGTIDNRYDANVFQGGAVNNAGLFVKSAGAGVTASLAAFNNTGTVRVSTGRMFLGAGSSTGHFDLAGGGIELSGNYGLGNGATITGTNAARVFGAVNVTGAASARYLEQAQGGELTGPGDLAVEHFTWTGGRLTGAGSTTVSATLALAGAGKEIDGRTLRILPGATATWAAGDIGMFPGGRIDNAGTFTTTYDGNALYAVTQSAAIVNTGLFAKAAGTGRTTLDVRFHNAGTARVDSGTLALSGGGSSTGHFDLAAGHLELLGGYALGTGTTITGTNATRLLGDVAVTGPVSARAVVHTAGVAGGAGTLTAETYDWQGGTLGGAGGTTAVTNSIAIAGPALKSIDGRTLRVAPGAVATWSAGDLRAGGGGAIDNLGTFRAASDNAAFPGDGAAATFANAGLFEKTAGAGATSVSLPFNNAGVLRVSSGSVVLGGGGSSSGQFDLLAGPIELAGGYALNAGATITGTNVARLAGNVTVNGAVAAKTVEHASGTLAGPGTLTAETLAWKGGTQAGAGVTAVTSALSLSAPSLALDGRRLTVAPAATATWSAGTLFTANGARVENAGLFDNAFDATLVYQTGALPVFDNTGEFRKSAGAGTTTFGIRFDNAGTARVNAGTLRLGAGGAATGHFDAAAPAAVIDLASDYALNAGAAFTGPGKLRLTNGVTTVNAPVSVNRLEQTAGTLTGPGHLTAATFEWKGGTLGGSGTTTAAAALTINGADLNLVGRTLAVAPGATATWIAGDVRFAQGATILNAGTFDIAADVVPTRVDAADAVFRNTGTLRKSAGANFAAFAGVLLDNPGALDVASGALIATVTQFDTATSTLTGGAWRVGNGATLDLGGGPGIAVSHAAVTLDGPTANFPKINDLADNRGALALTGGKQFLTGAVFANSGTVSADAASGVAFGNVFDNAPTGHYASAGNTAANFLFNAGTFTQSGPLTVNVQMVNNGPAGVADVSGPQTWGDGAHLVVNGGAVRLRTDAGSAAAPRLVIDARGGVTELRATQHLKALNVDGGVVKVIAPTPATPVVVRTASYTPGAGGGQLDLAANKLIVDYAPGDPSPVATIRDQIKAGFNAGGPAWAGAGIVSSAAAANTSAALGYAEASDVPAAVPQFGGESITGPAVLVRYTLAGDATLDGAVNFNDLVRLAQNYNTTVSATTESWWFNGDFTYDGLVNFNDLVRLAQNYNTALPTAPVPGATATFSADLATAFAAVPEPSSALATLAACALSALRRHRRTASS